MGGFERRDSLIPRHGGKGVEEFVEAVAPFQVIDEVSKRDTRADEHGRAAENLWITVNHVHGRCLSYALSNILALRAGTHSPRCLTSIAFSREQVTAAAAEIH